MYVDNYQYASLEWFVLEYILNVAAYTLWLEHELVRRRFSHTRGISEVEEWYRKRVLKIIELLEATGIALEDVAREMRRM